MKMRKKAVRASLQFERLEDRLALAGIVTVTTTVTNTSTVHTTDLKIAGDAVENAIAVTVQAGPVWRISGVPDVAGKATLVRFGTGPASAFVDVPVPLDPNTVGQLFHNF